MVEETNEVLSPFLCSDLPDEVYNGPTEYSFRPDKCYQEKKMQFAYAYSDKKLVSEIFGEGSPSE